MCIVRRQVIPKKGPNLHNTILVIVRVQSVNEWLIAYVHTYVHTYLPLRHTIISCSVCMTDLRGSHCSLEHSQYVRQEVGLGVALTCSTERNSDGAGARSLWMM